MISRPAGFKHRARVIALGIALAGLAGYAARPVTAQQAPDLFKSISFREIGPTFQGGRFVDFAVVESTPQVFYAASATGGLYKTENNGFNFIQVFESSTAASIGAVAVSQSKPDVVYVGTGEGNNSRSTNWGDGVYVSTDAGHTWMHSGLTDSEHIGRIVVHPTDPNTAYVAALGHLYSDNDERGLFKTIDGGKTWTKALDIKSESGKAVGVVDVALDPKNPLVLYAATYDKVRRPWTFAEAGPASALYKTTDAGKTWTKLAGGLPTGLLGRIGVAVSRQDSNTVFTVIENANQQGVAPDEQKKLFADGFGTNEGSPAELYRSDDAGKTWRQVAVPTCPAGRGGGAPSAVRGGPGCGQPGRGGFDGGYPPYYYGQIRIDPNNKEHIFVLSVGATQSTDGGKTWAPLGAGGDNHGLWIDPKDSKHMLLGYDHGISITFDAGQNWYHPDNLNAAQLYAVGYDMETPYNVYGGLQDNGSHKGPSTMKGGGTIPFEAWSTVGGGDGQYNVVDWKDSRYLYNESQFGAISRLDMVTGETAGIQYRGTGPNGEALRWNWCAPILVSPHNADVIYHAANVLLRSPLRGYTWEVISPDLTANDPAKRGGGGNIMYGTITTIDESTIVPGLIWVGTDDGNVQVTKNGGANWTNVRDKIPGHPGYWISRVEASHSDPGTAYVTATGLRNDDFRPFIWKTTDFGQTWTSIASDLPKESINVVREDPRNPNLLFVGTDVGIRASVDSGKSWTKLAGGPMAAAGGGAGFGRGGGGGAGGGRGGRAGGAGAGIRGAFPTVPVHDLKIHPRDHELIAGTHGRGIIIADIAAFEELTPQVMTSDAHLFTVMPVIRWTGVERSSPARLNFPGQSRPTDMGISYYLKTDAASDVKIRVYDGARMVAEIDGPKTAGVDIVRWNLEESRAAIEGEGGGGRGGRGGRGGGGGGGRGGGGGAGGAGGAVGPVTTPAGLGDYRIVLSVGGKDYEQVGRIVPDPTK